MQKLIRYRGLLQPTLVKITAWNAAEDPLGQNKLVAEVPKALLCSQSEYFDKLFQSGLSESKTGEVELNDVSRWILACFVRWLYHQRVYGVEFGSESTEETADGAQPDTPRITGLEDTDQSPTEATDELASLTAEDELDPNDPVTWPYLTLFELYVFADKYCTRKLRMTIFDIIQLKVLQRAPREYLHPCLLDMTFAASNLLAVSPLYRLLRDLYVYHGGLEITASNMRQQAENLTNLPPEFLAQCLVVSLRHASALQCAKCKKGKVCKATDHAAHDLLGPEERDICSYHEHGDNQEEAALCGLKWKLGLSDRLSKG